MEVTLKGTGYYLGPTMVLCLRQTKPSFHGILNVPDFIANSGGAICASVEYHGGTEAQAMDAIEDRIGANTREVLVRAKRTNSTPRQAAIEMATRESGKGKAIEGTS